MCHVVCFPPYYLSICDGAATETVVGNGRVKKGRRENRIKEAGKDRNKDGRKTRKCDEGGNSLRSSSEARRVL